VFCISGGWRQEGRIKCVGASGGIGDRLINHNPGSSLVQGLQLLHLCKSLALVLHVARACDSACLGWCSGGAIVLSASATVGEKVKLAKGQLFNQSERNGRIDFQESFAMIN